jgi:hypothetical protein
MTQYVKRHQSRNEHPVPPLWPVSYDSRFSKFFSALLKGIGTRNISRHLDMIPASSAIRSAEFQIFDPDTALRLRI